MAFGLYIHWPYCQTKCPYCDFNSHVAAHIDQKRWISAYEHEIQRLGAECPDEILETIFIGGGTPSLMDPEVVYAIIESARKAWRWSNDVEITMEANPGSVEAGRFAGYRAAGVNRVSLGIQALNDGDLKLLGRMHSADEARKAIGIAHSTFDRVNIDLIYARQNQTLEQWRSELDEALSLGTRHLSLYQLTIEDGTVFGRRFAAGQLRGLPDEDRAVDMFMTTQEVCDRAGLLAYEVSNHAVPGEESRHNRLYWQGGRYAGIGPGAHGRIGRGDQRRATEAIREPTLWLSAVERKGSGDLLSTPLSAMDRAEELLMMGLRVREGLSWELLAAEGIARGPWPKLDLMIEEKFVIADDEGIRTTLEGRLLLNTLVAELATDVPLISV
ncbi:radical SAM family heme chaperone HemW [Falsigemmobacter intermedius]|uniref:radical SAM family heme chaperone HemW n=1 Tax=Falsigemmobacter intermedius TaxID=1553448 RepID=UPI003EFD9295